MARRLLALPTIEEQQYVGFRGCLYTATVFTTRNYVAGDYLEFGVWTGDSFIKAYHSITELRWQHSNWMRRHPTQQSQHGCSTPEYTSWSNWNTRFFAFDSFAGLPKSSEAEMQEEWAEGSFRCSEQHFRQNLLRGGVDLKNVVTVPGLYNTSLTREAKQGHGLQRASIVHVDCDLYESTIDVLDFVTDLVVQGTVLIFDDWFFYQGRRDRGEQQACAEWLARNPQIELTPYWREPQSMSFIVNLST